MSQATLAARTLAITLLLSLSLVPAASAKPDKETAERAFDTLERATRSADFGTRAMAVEALGHAPKKKALPLIREALTDPQWNVRKAAMAALLQLKDKRGWEKAVRDNMAKTDVDVDLGIMPLLAHLSPKKGVRFVMKSITAKKFPQPDRYALAFERLGGDWMVQGFLAGLALKPGVVRDGFVKRLDRLPMPEATGVFKGRIKKESPAIQLAMLARIEALESIDDVGFLKPLLKSKDSQVALRAAVLLARGGDASGKKLLVETAKGPDEKKRLKALDALGHIAGKDLFDLVRPVVKDTNASPEMLRAAYRIFLKGKNKKLKKHLTGKLSSTDINFRAAAVAFIGDVKGRDALPDLYPLLGTGPLSIRLAAAESIGRLRQRESIPQLSAALQREQDPKVKLALLKAIGQIRDADIIPVIRFYITDSDIDVRRTAVGILAELNHESAVPDLEIVLRDRNKELRETALQALVDQDPEKNFDTFKRSLGWIEPGFLTKLVKSRKAQALRHVETALRSDRAEMRSTAFASLGFLKATTQQEIAERLAMKSRYPKMRLAGMGALMTLRGKGAIPTLEKLAKDADEQIKVAALEALGRLGAESARQLLLDTTADPAEKIRVAAAAALIRL